MKMTKVRVAIAGVGSCASSIVQFVELAKEKKDTLSGVMHDVIGGYQLSDVEFVAAFEVDQNKVGKDLSEAIFTKPTAAVKHIDVPFFQVTVEAGPLCDGLEGDLSNCIQPHEHSLNMKTHEVTQRLKDVQADVLVCFLPTGSFEAVRVYAEACAHAQTAFINATPEPVANDPEFVKMFEESETPLLGDDLRSHLGATTLHTALIELLKSRGIDITNTYQLNVGGNTDFLNLANPMRSTSKQKSKRKALFASGIDASEVAAGPNGYVSYLGDHKVCFLRLEGNSVLDSDISLEIRLQVEDSPNSAGVIANAMRVAKAAKDMNHSGVIHDVCPFLFKSPPIGQVDSESLRLFNEYVANAELKKV
ncbi:myo-inositol-1-phosphate synthase [Bacillus altitudinis]|nr:myo-inositol-1-phosphate synthase [Bacillus altitudinis A23-8]NEU52459.1 myo-inositol-1-phosphate synthase [Bacillus altitudinis]QOV51240.1 myo-inositol-1-phosphate synthase [Bacillus altitudinis]